MSYAIILSLYSTVPHRNQQKIANAYGCVLDAARHCFEQIRYDDDEDIESFLRHLELYLPDPSMVSDDIRYKCEHEKGGK